MTATTLRFNANTHTYRLDGRPIRGVTSLMKPADDPRGLIKWAGNTVADFIVDRPDEFADMRSRLSNERLRFELRAIPDNIRDTAGVRGIEVHAHATAILAGGGSDVPERLMPYIDGYLTFLKRFQVEAVATEFQVANRRHWYAGTADLLAYITHPDEEWRRLALIDYKTSRGAYGTTCCQTAAYARAEFRVLDGVEVPMEPVEWIGLAHVTPDGTDLYDMGPIDSAFSEFLSAAHLSKTMQRRKDLVGWDGGKAL